MMEPEPEAEAVAAKIEECVLTDGFPVSFALAADEVTATTKGGTLEHPRPYIVHLSRQSYLPLVFERLQEHFADSKPPRCSGEMWCSTEDGTPLKWHRPSGVLFDLHGTPEELPWRLVVHFTKFPQADVRQILSLLWTAWPPLFSCANVFCCTSCSARARSAISSGTS